MNTVRIGDVAELIRGVSYKKNDASTDNDNDTIAVLRANNIVNGLFELNELVYVPKEYAKEEQYINQNEIMITMSSGSKAHVGKVAIAVKDMNCVFGAFCGKLVANENVVARYLYYLLISPFFRTHIEKQCKGTNINNIKKEYILNFQFSLPPLPEQERIVARIEELFSELDKAVETLKKTKAQITVYRQAVLKEAFEGKYTNSTPKKHVKISDIADVGTGATPLTSNPDYYGGEIAWITSAKINDEKIYTPSEYITEKAILETNCKVYLPHTLLIAMYGEGKTRGKCAELMIPAATNQALAAIELHQNTEWFRSYIKCFLILNYQLIRRKALGGVQPNLNLRIIKNIAIPIFNEKNQIRIVEEIESRLSICDSIKKTVDTALQEAEALRQSILKEAFEGGLNSNKS